MVVLLRSRAAMAAAASLRHCVVSIASTRQYNNSMCMYVAGLYVIISTHLVCGHAFKADAEILIFIATPLPASERQIHAADYDNLLVQ